MGNKILKIYFKKLTPILRVWLWFNVLLCIGSSVLYFHMLPDMEFMGEFSIALFHFNDVAFAFSFGFVCLYVAYFFKPTVTNKTRPSKTYM